LYSIWSTLSLQKWQLFLRPPEPDGDLDLLLLLLLLVGPRCFAN
jgi:hypothetical protein